MENLKKVKLIFKTFISLCFLLSSLMAQNIEIRFKKFNVEDGLSASRVNCILQDHYGFMWFGTYDGLNRYDGFEFEIFRSSVSDKSSLSGNTIYDIIQDKNQNIWIATIGGLDLFHEAANSFIHFPHCNKDQPIVTKIREYEDGKIVVSGIDDLYEVDFNNQKLIPYRRNNFTIPKNTIGEIWNFYIDNMHRVWIFSKPLAVHIFDPINSEFFELENLSSPEKDSMLDIVKGFIEDENGNFWIGYDGGLIVYNQDLKIVKEFRHISSDNNSISSNFCNSVHQDAYGNIWVGTAFNGLNLYLANSEKWIKIQHETYNENSISSNSIIAINSDKNGKVWISTLNGLNVFVEQKRGFKTFQKIKGNEKSLSNNVITTFYEDNDSIIWIGTDGGGLNRFNVNLREFQHYEYSSDFRNSIPTNTIMDIYRDSRGILWIGAAFGALSIFNDRTGKFNNKVKFSNKSGEICFSHLMDIYEDYDNNIWFVTAISGVYKITDYENYIVKRLYRNTSDNENLLATDAAINMIQDQQGIYWIGTYYGLSRYDETKNKFTNFRYDPDAVSYTHLTLPTTPYV
jgi:ligand-binding sensor domain-containing protein